SVAGMRGTQADVASGRGSGFRVQGSGFRLELELELGRLSRSSSRSSPNPQRRLATFQQFQRVLPLTTHHSLLTKEHTRTMEWLANISIGWVLAAAGVLGAALLVLRL